MPHPKHAAAAILAALALSLALAPGQAQARTHQHHARLYGLPYDISSLHNYGPGALPGTFAFYDGPATNSCAQGSAAYIGQDRGRHPCF